MPTENRSSNTDPRDVFIRLNPLGLGEAELRKDSTGFEDPRTHGDYLLFLAGYRETHAEPQPHTEPIAWMVGTAFWWTKEEAERDAAATGLPIVGLGPMTCAAPAEQHHGDPVAWMDPRSPQMHATISNEVKQHNVKFGGAPASAVNGYTIPLYTHADPAEVERLVAANAEYARRHIEQIAEVEQLRAALKFYADREHFHVESGNWDTVSGEPLNILWCGDEPDFIEDGTVARNALSASAEPSAAVSFQSRVQPWLMECFGEMIAGDRQERNHRLLEEALELVQALGATAGEAHQLVDYVFDRAVGEPAQEVGGVMVTMAALCLANGLDMHQLAETELSRIWTKVEQIRAKQASKPQFGPLPGVYPDRKQ